MCGADRSCLQVERKFRLNFVPHKVLYMSSFGYLVNRINFEDLEENDVAENKSGSGSKEWLFLI